MNQMKILCDGVETVTKFSYLGNRLNATGECETAVTAKTRIGWMKFRKCSEILKGKRFSLNMKEVYKSCVDQLCCMEVKHDARKKKKWQF